jgi:hypothetical protein
MNLERKSLLAVKRGARLFFQRRRARFGERIGQNARLRLVSYYPFMSLSFFVRRATVCFCWGLFLGIPTAVFGQTNYYRTNGTEYAVIGSLPGDQVFPDAAVTPSGGFVVWQDNITDGDGWGVSARRLDSTLSGTLSTFRVNVQGTNDQANPRVALLKNNGAVFVWQGGKPSQEQIYARFLTPTNTWLTTNDVPVNSQLITNVLSYTTNKISTIITNWNAAHTRITSYTTNTTRTVTTNTVLKTLHFQINPAVATLTNGNVAVVWTSFNQAGSNSLEDVYGQILSPTGQKVGTNFLVNQFISYNQRTPAVAALANGGFVVAWVSEQERAAFNYTGFDNTNGTPPSQVGLPSVDIYARLYRSNGVAQGNEFLVNTNALNPCANPGVAAAADGSFMVTWGGRDLVNPTNGWDIYARTFSSAGVGGATALVNTHWPGNQYAPHLSAIGGDYLVVWTSLGQDGSREGVYGRFVHEDGSPVGGEFLVNTTTIGQQMQPAVASDGVNQFLVVWTGFTLSPNSFDLFAQRYINVSAILEAMDAPFVYAPFVMSNGVYQPQLQVSWPVLLGISVANYEVYADGAGTPMALTTSNFWTMTAANGLTTNSPHLFQVDYVTTDGRRSPISPSAGGTTWSGQSWGGIPAEWMAMYFGSLNVTFNGNTPSYNWPFPNVPLASGGPTLLQVFLSGGNPLDPGTWLQTALTRTSQGLFLSWNTQPGFTYQVQVTTNFTTWSNLGSPRFAAGSGDSIFVGSGSAGYYRVLLLRQ